MRSVLSLKLSQQLSMTPQLQQAIRLLQLSSVELELEIRNALEMNPLLEQIETNASTEELEDLQQKIPELRFDRIFTVSEQNLDPLRHKCTETTLRQHLLWQMEMAHLKEHEILIATALIDAISDEGYLLCPLSEIQQSIDFNIDIAEIKTVLSRIQQFDPIGVGAQDLAECLILQLNALPSTQPWITEAKKLVLNHLPLLGKKDYGALQAALGLDVISLKAVIKLLTSLNPRPGNAIASKKSEYLIPDVIAYKKNDRLIIELNKECLPALQLHSHYATIIKNKSAQGSQHFKEQLKEAKWFLKGLKTRHETLLKVARAIMEQQREFLEGGDEWMNPLNLQDIASKVGLHESTVSRITTQKYILTPRGIFELKHFFSSALPSLQGKRASSTAIRALIKKLVAEEPSQSPFSDDKITKLLLERGISVARRTVTKYREAMQIPSSTERKNPSFN